MRNYLLLAGLIALVGYVWWKGKKLGPNVSFGWGSPSNIPQSGPRAADQRYGNIPTPAPAPSPWPADMSGGNSGSWG